ncbi:MAG TPA: phosphoenolpyruvate carboxykinase (ATP) [Urbifossiella sp.]|jgi:phosphoenolpyruvate carboxykinase (ATP)|nr:phosphoenolpyruvate carboxykinase (ATP) [Urbifossiella sp.]
MDGSPGFALANPGRVWANLPAAALVEHAVRRGEGELTSLGAFAALTGARTGRSPKDKFTVRDELTAPRVDWAANRPMDPAAFARLTELARAYLQNRELFVFDGYAAAHPAHRLPLRVVTERAWHSLFARCLFLRPAAADLSGFAPEWTILHAADLRFDPARDGTNSDAVVALDFTRKLVLVAGTHYAGEIKKAIFTVMNFVLPERGVLSMHCSANVGAEGDVALFFGLSGTGKTTLSADPDRRLIGDDEHGWAEDGVFNVEGGCYAKTIKLSRAGEQQIYDALRFGCVLENVPVDPATREPDFDSQVYTENTRAAYPVDFIPHCELSGRGGHPRNVFFLTCDAFGVLPPLSRLTPRQAMDYFLCGYTAKVAGTEAGVTGPTPEFSTCFAKPFLPLPPKRYAELLKAKLEAHAAPVWLVNTGWSGGPPGVGSRMPLPHTRALLKAALTGALADVPLEPDPVFGLAVPARCPGVPDGVLQPRRAWADPAAYDRQATQLADRFKAEAAKYQ